MKILIFLDEIYYKQNDKYYSKFNAGRFLQNLSDKHELIFALPTSIDVPTKFTATTVIDEKYKVVELGEWRSLIEYIKKNKNNRALIYNILSPIIDEVDVVWIRMPGIPSLEIGRICMEKQKPLFVHIAGDISEAYKNERYSGLLRVPAFILSQYMHYSTTKLLKDYQSNKIIPLCTGLRLMELYKHQNTRFFIDNEFLTESVNETAAKIRQNKFLYVGRLIESKGIKLLLDIWKEIDDELELHIVGYGELETKVFELSEKDKRIIFHGFKSGDELKVIYRSCGCLIMPSILSEGFPRVILEAWSYGQAVISSDIGGIRALGVDNENILFFTPGNSQELIEKISRISNCEELYKHLTKRAYITAQNNSMVKMIDIIDKLASEMVQ